MSNERPLSNRPRLSRNTQRPTNDLQRKPPQALDLEQAVLGALMLEKNAIDAVADILKADSFYDPKHQSIYKAILDLFNKPESEPIDILTVSNQLRKNGELEAVGGNAYLTSLTAGVNSSANIENHARLVTEYAIKRELIQLATDVEKKGYDEGSDAFELLDKAQEDLYQVAESSIRKNFSDVRSVMREAILELDAKKDQPDGLTGVPSGLRDLDRITSGWQKSDLVILAARPGMGKTAFVLSTLRNAAVRFEKPVAIFSLEMSSKQLVTRLISAEAQLHNEKLKNGRLTAEEWNQLHDRIGTIEQAPIYIDDTPALSVSELRTKARRLRSRFGVEMVIVDYMQLMTGGEHNKPGSNREQEVSIISRTLKNIAKELDIPVIALSQLSRQVEVRGGDKRPQLSDLRESGSIEQDADMVLFLYRPEYYGISEDEEGNNEPGRTEVILAKHRNGGLGTVNIRFIGQYTKFVDMDSEDYVAGSGGQSSFPQSGSVPSEFDSGSAGSGGQQQKDGQSSTASTRVFGSKINQMRSNNEDFPSQSSGDSSEEPPF